MAAASLEATACQLPCSMEEPAQRALFVARHQPEDVGPEPLPIERPGSHERWQPIRCPSFNFYKATMILKLNAGELLPKIIAPTDLNRLRQQGFRRSDQPHITILDYQNGRRLIRVFDGDRRRLSAVEAAAQEFDWSWRPTGGIYPFQRDGEGRLKILTLVECPGRDDFYDHLESHLPGLQLERDILHVALMRRVGKRQRAAIGGLAVGYPAINLKQMAVYG